MPAFAKSEWRIIVVGAVCLLLALLFLFTIEDRSTTSKTSDHSPEIARVKFQKNDTRYKPGKSFSWQRSKENQSIHSGDAIFSGDDSTAQITLNEGGEITVGSNSMLYFRKIENQNTVDLASGNFRMNVNGAVKVVINGKLTKMEGTNSEIQVFVPKGRKSQIRVLRGQVAQQVEEKSSPRTWRLYDLYERKANREFVDRARPSKDQTFEVEPKFVKDAEPTVTSSASQIPLLNRIPAKTSVQLQTPAQPIGFIVQASADETFRQVPGQIYWSTSSNITLKFSKAGNYYYRFRSVMPDQTLSDWSGVSAFTILDPPLPIAPKRADAPAKIVASTPVPKRAPNPPPKIPQKPERIPASVDAAIKTKLVEKPSLFLNDKYKNSTVSVQGFLWSLQSTQQYYQNQPAPMATGAGVAGLRWFGKSGLEGFAKMSVTGMNPAGKETSLKDLEARYHYRFFTGFPFGWSRELQISLFGGYEIYRNSGNLFSNRYDLMKFGTTLEFPWSSRLSAGGEFVFGYGFDKSRKLEASGHINYFLNRQWSAGLGYRLNLFQAGSSSASPDGSLPYREGYSEGYSILNYHF